MKNRIPRQFYRIAGTMLIDTNCNAAGDEIHVTKNDYGYLGYNTRTGKHFYLFVSMIRNGDIFHITEILK